MKVLDEPGALGELALAMATAGINIDSVYVTTKAHVVLDVDDLAGATHVAGGMAVMSNECGVVGLDLLVGRVYWFVYLRPRSKD